MKMTTFNRDLYSYVTLTKNDFSLMTGKVAIRGMEECGEGDENNMPVPPQLVVTEEWEATERFSLDLFW